MNPLIVEAVLWGALWLVLRSVLAVVIFWGGFILSGIAAAVTEKHWPGVLGIFLTILIGAGWEVFSIVQIVLEIIRVVQLVTL